MSELDLTNQLSAKLPIQEKQAELEGLLFQRQELWYKLDIELRKQWLFGGKDPILSAAYLHYVKLRAYFEGISE